MSRRPRGVAVWFALAVLGAWTSTAYAQSAGTRSVEASGGVAFRGPGETGACCGPIRSTLERAQSYWMGLAVSRWVGPRVGLDVEATWAPESQYTAYVQGFFGDEPYRAYRADNQVATLTLVGLLRGRAAKFRPGSLDVVAGLGWARQSRTTHLTSLVFRPGPHPVPEHRLDVDDTRLAATVVAGVEAAHPVFGARFEMFARGRVYWGLGRDGSRTDLELGQPVWRFGIGVRRDF